MRSSVAPPDRAQTLGTRHHVTVGWKPQTCAGALLQTKRPALLSAGLAENRSNSSFVTSLADHLQIGHTQVAILFFACRLLHLALFLLLCLFLCLRFVLRGTRDRKPMAHVRVD